MNLNSTLIWKPLDTKILMAFASKYLPYNPLKVRDSGKKIIEVLEIIKNHSSFGGDTIFRK